MIAPKLRFSEFKDEWIEKTIDELNAFLKDGTHGTHIDDNNSRFYLLSAKNIIDEKVIFDKKDRKINETEFKSIYKNYELKEKDILLTVVGTIGRVALFKNEYKNFAFQRSVAFIRFDESLINSNFVLQFMLNNYFQNQLKLRQVVSAQPGIYLNDLSKISIQFPSLKEQTKIAEFLSAVDDKISQLSRELELLNQYKKGVMQKIFSQEIRFKNDNGEDFGEWVETNLNKISNHIGGTALESFVSLEADYKFISIGNYSTNGNYIDNGQRIELNDKTQAKLLNKNDLVMVLNDKTSTGDLIGSTLLIDRDNEYIYNQRSERIICNLDLVNPKFLWHYLNSFKMRDEIKKLAQGGTQIYINFSSVLGIGILLPLIQEQEKIAEFLTAIDEQIDHTTAQLTHTKQWKKGLLQQMFV